MKPSDAKGGNDIKGAEQKKRQASPPKVPSEHKAQNPAKRDIWQKIRDTLPFYIFGFITRKL